MKVLIFGGSGFIGKHLIPVLVQEGYEVFLFIRSSSAVGKAFSDKVTAIEWDARSPQLITEHFSGDYLIINLAGESIGAKLWTKKQKYKIRSSRLTITKAIAAAVSLSRVKPIAVLQGSAIGYYGSQSDIQLDESSPKGHGFLSDVVDEWEKSAKPMEDFNSRIIYLRTGIVLGNDGGIMPLMLLPFKFFAGGHIGNGKQWFSWIHIEDIVKAIVFLMKNENASGIYNLTSPEPIRMWDFARLAGNALGRPSWLHIPAFALNVLPEGMTDDLLLTSQRVIPARLLEAGYGFIFATIRDALDNLILNKN